MTEFLRPSFDPINAIASNQQITMSADAETVHNMEVDF